ncbi:hypothetical protein KPH14_005072 [Odynerus spinipes]|uniref:Cation-dependent mannose-6-phosphate receptor n=1 Tax=Odynerus spinipes TaxID=1348599 RepID=A0AAD9VNR0_9HYME|nr:hypothetical protein KPH14_005072 [Odynerus spinipes]
MPNYVTFLSDFMMFVYSSMFITFGLFLIIFCDTTLSKCNNISTSSCIVLDEEAKKLINLIPKKSSKPEVHHMFYVDPSTSVPGKIAENKTKSTTEENGSLCAITSLETKPIDLGIVEWMNLSSKSGCKNISIPTVSGNFNSSTYVDCCTKYNIQYIPDTNQAAIYKIQQLQALTVLKKQLLSNGLSTGSTLVILLFVFSGLYFIGGAILLKFLRGATGWEVLPNHKFWCDLPSLIRDGIAFTFNCCRADSYERI